MTTYTDIIDAAKLGRFLTTLKNSGLPMNDWQANKVYKVGYTVVNNGKLYRCTTAHTSGSTFNATNWESIGGGGGNGISNWSASTQYNVDDVVINDDVIYRCNTAHTSSNSFSNDASNWTLISGQGISKILYSSATWLNANTTITLNSVITPYDFLIIKCSFSLDGSTSEISKVTSTTTDIGDRYPLTMNRNTTQYCVLEAKITSSTQIDLEALGLSGFTHFRVDKVIGVIGGGSAINTLASASQISSLF